MFAMMTAGVLGQQGAAVGGGFSPDDIATLSAWFDASDSATITHSSDVVSQWNDRSGNGRHVTPISTGPTTNASTLNSLNVVDFNDTPLQRSSSVLVNASDGHYTAFAVWANAEAGNTGPVSSDTAAGRGVQMLSSSGGAGRVERVGNFAGSTVPVSDQTAAAAVSLDTHCVMASRLTASELEVWVGGVSDGATACTGGSRASAGMGFVVGARYNTSTYWMVGKIAEICVFADDLAAADMNDVGNYLADKWGLTWTDI